jgi:hypothetical protein
MQRTRRAVLAGGAALAAGVLGACAVGGATQQPEARAVQPATVEWRHLASSDAVVMTFPVNQTRERR